ncbi:protein SPA1-RELATED 4-like isoform X2 [Papaver somniferum]|uniref:protein SPA1-RELATED 4-like isoform X2 n=1 Tax=Papaver somniferum TaxID=3469 RepID=UPI000E7031D5|nr:protein SPA1-RELATED 4-like isoform X2 [Papaver somniferum]
MEGSSELGLEKYKISKRMQLNAYGGGSGDKLDSVHGGRVDLSRANGVYEKDHVTLRKWLDRSERLIDHHECLHIFKQIVEIVSISHSRGKVVHNVRPSCFILSSSNFVSFVQSSSNSSLESDDLGHGESPLEKSPKGAPESIDEREMEDCSNAADVEESKKNTKMNRIMLMERSWYTSPEEIAGAPSSLSSDIYCLGVLLFELLCTFTSVAEKLRTMSNLRHRILSPNLLLNCSKEASFCLWLLHPQPNTRPKMIEVLQSNFLSEPKDNLDELDASTKLKEKIEEQELLLKFLLEVQQRKREAANKLHDAIYCLSSDIDVLKQKLILKIKSKAGLYPILRKDDPLVLKDADQLSLDHVTNDDLASSGTRKRCRTKFQIHGQEEELNKHLSEFQLSEMHSDKLEIIMSKSSRLMENFPKLESAYFSTRCRITKQTENPVNRVCQKSSNGKGSTALTEGSSVDNSVSKGKSEWINPFLEGLCKYLSFSKLKVRAELKQGDLLNSSNLVCAMSFDRDKGFFATAGVNRKIKIFECDMIVREDREIHYPIMEMASRSKLSSICWNSYIQSQIASSDFEGVVQIWDVTRGQVFMEMREHERRVWSVDFSLADPTKLASGSDDGAVKLWNINQGRSICTIKTKANVCCVQFPPDSSCSLTVGSADHKIYSYDLRSTRTPLSTLIGHTKTVSYVKYVDSTTLVSASTDNSLKLWDMSACTSHINDSPLQTFTGHTNSRNFVGLSVYDDYITTGSETNEVFIYHKAFPMPVLSFKFNNTDALSCQDVEEPFISSVCWRDKSTLLAANSAGNIKLLEMD